jgi:hypothetical protein
VAEPPTVYQAAVANAAARNSFMVANSGAALHSNRLGGWRSSLGTASGRGK